MLPRILAQAVVDPGGFEIADRVNHQAFLVTVDGRLEGGDALGRRVYEIAAVDEQRAAFEGIERYVVEMQRPN